MNLSDFFTSLSSVQRILFILVLATLTHFGVRALRRFGEWLLTPRGAGAGAFAVRHPKLATVSAIVLSALTFGVYFSAIGLVFREFGISLKAYFASASVIGLAVGFGSQGLIQDLVIGLTLIFSDVLAVGDMVDLSGQAGRVERIGLRFTVLVNALDQRVFVPNRNISQINRYPNGRMRVYLDVQLLEQIEERKMIELVQAIARGLQKQHRAIVLAEPEVLGPQRADPGGWRFLRVRFDLWPGQTQLVEAVFKPRLVAAIKNLDPAYADWMLAVTYRA